MSEAKDFIKEILDKLVMGKCSQNYAWNALEDMTKQERKRAVDAYIKQAQSADKPAKKKPQSRRRKP